VVGRAVETSETRRLGGEKKVERRCRRDSQVIIYHPCLSPFWRWALVSYLVRGYIVTYRIEMLKIASKLN
jgi:hypothetical protein